MLYVALGRRCALHPYAGAGRNSSKGPRRCCIPGPWRPVPSRATWWGRRSIKRERGVEFLVAERPRLLLDDQGLPRPWGQGGLFPLSRTRADNRAYGVIVPPVPLRLRGLYRYCEYDIAISERRQIQRHHAPHTDGPSDRVHSYAPSDRWARPQFHSKEHRNARPASTLT